MVDLARHLNARDPRRAASLGPTLERLKSQVDDRLLRAEAIGELCVTARSVKGTYDRNDLERWYNELLDMADVDPRIAARGYYERSRWKTITRRTLRQGTERPRPREGGCGTASG